MKLYDFGLAANTRRVRIFLAEKDLDIPKVDVNLRQGEHLTDSMRARNPFMVLPVLELDDGTCIGESVAICRYLEELHPTPALFGRDARERAIIEMWNRRVEIDGFMPVVHAVRNSNPLFAGRVIPGHRSELPQLPDITERGKDMLKLLLARLDDQLAGNEFVAGAAYSIADITAYCMLLTAAQLEVPYAETCPNVARWFDAIAARPSSQA